MSETTPLVVSTGNTSQQKEQSESSCCGAPLYGTAGDSKEGEKKKAAVASQEPGTEHGETADGEEDTSRTRALIALKTATAFCFVFMLCELAGGYFAHSLAILTDAAHLLTDVGGFALAIFSLTVSARAACGKFSYGWHRAEVVGTLASLFTIWGLVFIIVWEAIWRIFNDYQCAQHDTHAMTHHQIIEAQKLYHFSWLGADGVLSTKYDPSAVQRITMHDGSVLECEGVKAPLMVIIGSLGLAVNVCVAGILTVGGHHGHSHGPHETHTPADGEDHGHSHEGSAHGHSHGGGGGGGVALNAAFLHALGDSIQSIGVILAAAFIWWMNVRTYGVPTHATSPYNAADAVSSILFAIITLFTTKSLIKQLLGILMESTPEHIDTVKVAAKLKAIPGVVDVHDLHIWSISAERASMSVHLVAATGCQGQHAQTLKAGQAVCESFGISHHTIQVDDSAVGSDNCCHDLH